MVEPWDAPTLSTGPLHARVVLPGSKSLTNRYLVLAALAEHPSRLRSPLRSRDTLLMAAALRRLGVVVEDVPSESGGVDDWVVTPGPLTGGGDVDCGLAGTVMRFLPAVAALATGDTTFDGDPHARHRPMRPVLDGLRALGVEVEDGGTGTMPFTIRGTGSVRGGIARIDASSSSQFVSALLLAGARFERGLVLEHTGDALPSLPHIAMTVEVLRDAGVVLTEGPGVQDAHTGEHGHRWEVAAGPIGGIDVDVEPDLSNAAPFLAAAVLAPEGSSVTVPGWPQRTTQAGDGLRDLLDEMGADVDLTQDGLVVTSTGDLYGIEADLHDVGELTPTVAALAALADTPSHLHGIAHLRGHETDRLAALVTEINRLGGDAEETADGLRIRPRPMHGGEFASYADHRMATAGAVIGLRVPGVRVEDVATTGKTLPDFPGLWAQMLAGQDRPR